MTYTHDVEDMRSPAATRADDLIFDVGMHSGRDSRFYLEKGYRVVAVEANPDLCASAGRELGSYVESGSLTIVNRAIADHEGEVDLYLNEQISEWSTIDAGWAERYARLGAPSRRITVSATPLSRLIACHGVPYYLKIDIEGADTLCLEALHDLPERPRFVSIETQRDSFDTHFNQFALLWTLGYRRFKIVAQHRIPRQTCPYPPREGRYVDQRFATGSTGLFGNELPGRWLNIEEALRKDLRILRTREWIGDGGRVRRVLPRGHGLLDRLSGWYDVHASLPVDATGAPL